MPLIRRPAGDVAPASASAAGGGGLASADADARWSAARRMTAPDDVGALAAALDREADPRVREAILTSLARIGDAASARAVAGHVRSDDAALRTAALDALRGMPRGVMACLPGLLADPDSDVRLLACELARDAPGPEPARLLCELIERDAEANVVAAAVDVLAEVGGREALPALGRCAARFADQPFLAFSIRVASERIGANRLA
jgi:hypothetical protein